jgi:hypothetical protein
MMEVYLETDLVQERLHVVYVACGRYRHQYARIVELFSSIKNQTSMHGGVLGDHRKAGK